MPELPGARAPLELSEKADLQSKSIFRSPSTSGKNEELASSDLSEPETTQYPQGLPLFFIVAAIALSIFLASLDMTIIATAIPKITDEFHGLDKVSWYGSAFFMTNGAFQPLWGKAYKFFSLKMMFITSIVVFEIGSLISGIAPNSTTLIVGRAITGLGASGIGTGAYTIIAFVASPQDRPMYTGIIGLSYGVASVIGPLLGGIFADKVSWRWCFYINLPIGGLSALVILVFFHAPKAAAPTKATWKERLSHTDLVGTALAMGAIIAYILALQYGGQTKAWGSSQVVGLLVGFLLLMTSLGVWEYFRKDEAMLVPRLIKQRSIGLSCLYVLFFTGPYYLILYVLPIYFQSVSNASPIMSGVRNLPLILGATSAMILSGILIAKTGLATLIEVFGAAFAMISAGLLYTLDIHTIPGKWIGYQLLAGISWGAAFQVPIIVAQASVTPADTSSVTAMILFFQCIGGTFFITAAQSAFVNTLIQKLPIAAPGVDAAAVIATGATQIRTSFSSEQIPEILVAYMAGITVAMSLAIGGTGVAFILSLCSSWKRLPTGKVEGAGGAV